MKKTKPFQQENSIQLIQINKHRETKEHKQVPIFKVFFYFALFFFCLFQRLKNMNKVTN
jgi:hypothetical protein